MSSLDTPKAPEAVPTKQELPLAPVSTYTGREKWLVLTAAFLGWMFDGLEMGIFPQIARSALNRDMLGFDATTAAAVVEESRKWWHQLIDAGFLFGAALGGPEFGWLGDRIGRVKAMAYSILVYSAFTGLLYFARSPEQLAALRFTAAIGMGGEWALGVALVMEVWDAKYRPLLAGMIGAAANVGFLIVGAIGRAIQIDESNWRYLVLVGAAPALLTFIIRLFVPESHAWKAAQTAKPTRPLTELFSDRKLTRSALLAILFASITLLGTWGAVQKIPSWVGSKDMSGGVATAQGSTQMSLAVGAIVGCLIAPLVAAWLN